MMSDARSPVLHDRRSGIHDVFFLPQRLYTVFRSLLKQQNIQAAHAPALVVLPHATC